MLGYILLNKSYIKHGNCGPFELKTKSRRPSWAIIQDTKEFGSCAWPKNQFLANKSFYEHFKV